METDGVITETEIVATGTTGDLVEDGKMIEEADTEMAREGPGESPDGAEMMTEDKTGQRMCPTDYRAWHPMLQSHFSTCQIFPSLTIPEMVSSFSHLPTNIRLNPNVGRSSMKYPLNMFLRKSMISFICTFE